MKPTKRMCRDIALVALIAAGITELVSGCQTTIPVAYTEPARFTMTGVSTVGIISNDGEAMAAVSSALAKTGKYTIANAEEMSGLMPWLRQYTLLADGIEISAADLVREYEANEVRADGKYKGKILKVSGTVTDFRSGAVRLGVGSNSVDVYVAKTEIEKVAALNKGDAVTVVGKSFGLGVPESDDINEILEILGGGGRHVNLAAATFFIPKYTGTVDAVLTVNMSNSAKIESKQTQQAAKAQDGTTLKDANGKTVYKDVTQYRKVVSVTMAYTLIRTHDGTTIGSGETTGSAQSDYADDPSNLNDATLISSAKNQPIQKLVSDMVPTQRTLSIKLAKSDTQDKDVKTALNEANKLVKANDYANAAEAYGKIYADTKDFAAGYNQAVLTEVALGTDKAVLLMEELAKASDRDEAKSMLAEMRRRNAANQQAAAQLKN